MNSCNGVPITEAMVARTRDDLISVHQEAKADGFLPRTSSIKIEEDYPGTAGIDSNGDLYADPLFLSCQTREELKAVIAHESGHHHDALVNINHMQSLPQLGFVAVFTAVAMSRAFKFVGRQIFGSNEVFAKPHKNNFSLASLFACHVLNGATLMYEGRQIETRADRYSAYVMNSGQPLANSLRKYSTTNIDSFVTIAIASQTTEREYAGAQIAGILHYGPSYWLTDEHPTDAERIQRVQSPDASEHLPFGMDLPPSYLVKRNAAPHPQRLPRLAAQGMIFYLKTAP